MNSPPRAASAEGRRGGDGDGVGAGERGGSAPFVLNLHPERWMMMTGTVVAAGYGRGCVSRLSRGDGGCAPRALSSAHAGSAARSATAAAAASVNPFAAATTLSMWSDASGDADDARGRRRRGGRGGPRERDARGAREGSGRAGRRRRWMPYRAVSWRGASIEWRCRGGKGEHVIASATGPPAGLLDSHEKMMKLSSHSQSSVYVLCFAAASLDAPSSSRTARRCIAPLTANPKPRPVPAVVAARRPRASSIPSARMRREEKKATPRRRPAVTFDPPSSSRRSGLRRRPSASLSVRPSVHPSPPTSLVANFPRPNANPTSSDSQSINRSSITWRTCASTPLPARRICWDPSCRFAQSPGRAGRRGWDR